jgi:hypothetical protein
LHCGKNQVHVFHSELVHCKKIPHLATASQLLQKRLQQCTACLPAGNLSLLRMDQWINGLRCPVLLDAHTISTSNYQNVPGTVEGCDCCCVSCSSCQRTFSQLANEMPCYSHTRHPPPKLQVCLCHPLGRSCQHTPSQLGCPSKKSCTPTATEPTATECHKGALQVAAQTVLGLRCYTRRQLDQAQGRQRANHWRGCSHAQCAELRSAQSDGQMLIRPLPGLLNSP